MNTPDILWSLLRTTLLLTVCGGICFISLRNIEGRLPRLSRFLWLAVLLVGWFWIQPVVSVPWGETGRKPSSAMHDSETIFTPIELKQTQSVLYQETAMLPKPADIASAPALAETKPIDWSPLIIKTVFAVWIGGMVVSIFLAAAGYFQFLSLLRKTVPAGDDFAGPWMAMLTEHGIAPRTIPMVLSKDLGPALIRTVYGYRLVVPRELWSELSEGGRSGILKHELEHFRRRDVWKSFFVRVLALPHWFNPIAHLAVHRFEEAAEMLCDRAAFDMRREGPEEGIVEFAKTLLLLHENAPTQFVARQSIFGRGLKHRVACLLHENQNPYKKVSTMKKILLISGAVVLLAACLFRVEFVEKIVAQETEVKTKTVQLAQDDILVFDKGQWKNKKSDEIIPPGTVIEGTHGSFRLDADGEHGTVIKLSGGGATGTGKHVEFSNGGNKISVSVLSSEEMKKIITMDDNDAFVYDNGVWTNEKTGKGVESGAIVAGMRGAFRLESKDGIGSVALINGFGAVGSGKYIRWSNGGSGFSGGKAGNPKPDASKKHVYSSVVDAETNKPFAGVKATLYFAKNGKVETRTTQTDAEGRIVFPLPSELNADMEAGTTILVEKDGYVSEQDGRQAKWSQKFLEEGKEICKTFPLQKSETITGRLVDENGKPLSGIALAVLRQLVRPYGHEGRDRIESFDLKSDTAGKFKINAAKDEKIVFWAVPDDLAPAFVFPDKKRGDLGDIVVKNGIRPEVKVLDKDGKPVSDVWVNISLDGEYFGISHAGQSRRAALTDQEGIARFRPIIEGKYQIRINERPWEMKYNSNSIEQSITWRDDLDKERKPVKGVFVFPTVDFTKSHLETTLQAQNTVQVDIRFSDKAAVSERDYNVNISGDQGNDKTYYSRPSSDFPSGYKGDGLFSYQVPVDLKNAKLSLHSSTNYSYRVRLAGNSEWIKPENGFEYPLGPITKDREIDVTVIKSPKITLDVVDESGKPVKEFYGWAEYADTKTPATVKFDGDKIRVDVTPEHWHEMTWEWATSEMTMGGILDIHFKYKNFGKSEQKINNEGILPDRELRLYVVGKGYEIQSQLIPGMKEGEEKNLTVVLKRIEN